MRYLRLALCVACLPFAGLRAADDDSSDQKQQPEEIPNFNQLDEYVYVPKSTLSLGERFLLRGPKVTFAGQGSNPSTVDPGSDPTVPNISRTYIDGTVSPDTRSVPVTSGLGGTISVPIASDGRTNTWSYENSGTVTLNYGLDGTQLQPNGDIAFHTYSAEVTDTGSHEVSGDANAGVELILDRDMGKVGKHFKWSLTAGFSISDIRSSVYTQVPTTITTLTDTYDLFGQVPPAAPYSSPNFTTQTVYNSLGLPVSGSNSTTQTQSANEVILLGNVPLNRTEVNTYTLTTNRYFVDGAYYTLRVGPTLEVPIGSHFTFNISAGPTLIYAGSVANVLEDLNLATNEDFPELYTKENSKILPGAYVDVDLQYHLTDTAGFYLGGVYQVAGGYGQTIASGIGTEYTTRIDFGGQEGLKGGLTVRF
jgi:hypothetical protein